MAEFAPNQPVVVEEPSVVVDKGLPVGTHLFELQVQDNLGQLSTATSVTVVIFRQVVISPVIPPIIPPIKRPG